MNRSILIAGFIALAATGWVLSGMVGHEGPADAGATEAAGPAPAPSRPAERRQPVQVRLFEAQDMTREIRVTGQTEAERWVEIKAEIKGRVTEVLAAEGAPVTAGQPIATLAAEDRPAALAEAKALLAQRQAEYDAAAKLSGKGFSSDIQLARAAAARDSAKAQLDRAQSALNHTRITAPFDGVLDDRPVEVGDFLDIGHVVARVVDMDPIRVAGQVSERFIGAVHMGQAGQVRLPGLPAPLPGQVSYVASAADPVTRTFRVEVTAANPDGRLRQGLTAEIILPLDQTRAHLVSPAVLALDDAGTVGVTLVDDDDIAHFTPIEILGDAEGGLWIGGLPDQARIITVGQDYVGDGQPVAASDRPQPQAPDGAP